MFEMKKIVCAVDVREPSHVTMEYAAELAKRLGAELTLLHVSHLPPASAVTAEKALEQWRAEAESRVGAPVRARLLFGDAIPEILRLAQETSCGLLVVGARGRARVARRVLGSVAERLIANAPCPVLVVHDHRLVEKADEAEEVAQYR